MCEVLKRRERNHLFCRGTSVAPGSLRTRSRMGLSKTRSLCFCSLAVKSRESSTMSWEHREVFRNCCHLVKTDDIFPMRNGPDYQEQFAGNFLFNNVLQKDCAVLFPSYFKTIPERKRYMFWCSPSVLVGWYKIPSRRNGLWSRRGKSHRSWICTVAFVRSKRGHNMMESNKAHLLCFLNSAAKKPGKSLTDSTMMLIRRNISRKLFFSKISRWVNDLNSYLYLRRKILLNTK